VLVEFLTVAGSSRLRHGIVGGIVGPWPLVGHVSRGL
jgi:hypothetical protein